jgi:hypothetical protein
MKSKACFCSLLADNLAGPESGCSRAGSHPSPAAGCDSDPGPGPDPLRARGPHPSQARVRVGPSPRPAGLGPTRIRAPAKRPAASESRAADRRAARAVPAGGGPGRAGRRARALRCRPRRMCSAGGVELVASCTLASFCSNNLQKNNYFNLF